MLLGALGVILLGRILGLVDLYVVGIAGVILLGAAVLWVRAHPIEIEATRRLRPSRTPAGGSVDVELCLSNASKRRSPVIEARDPLDGERVVARLLVAPLAPGEVCRTSYEVTADRRGVFGVGPLEIFLRDPFGLAARTSKQGSAATLTVLPRVETVPPLPRSPSGPTEGGLQRPPFPGQSGEDFHSLRPYAPGDDLRRVHWTSTARSGQVMIRQDDHPALDRSTVVLDLRMTDPESFEAAVSAAASVASAAGAMLVRLVDTGGRDSGYSAGRVHSDLILDSLAAAKGAAPDDGAGAVSRVLGLLRVVPGAGALVVVTSVGLGATEMRNLGGLTPRFAPVVVMVVGAGVGCARAAPVRSTGPVRVVAVTAGSGFGAAWREAIARSRADRGAPAGTDRGPGA